MPHADFSVGQEGLPFERACFMLVVGHFHPFVPKHISAETLFFGLGIGDGAIPQLN